jgi:uncharacterized hydantoinase/oxoprolinase family protein
VVEKIAEIQKEEKAQQVQIKSKYLVMWDRKKRRNQQMKN